MLSAAKHKNNKKNESGDLTLIPNPCKSSRVSSCYRKILKYKRRYPIQSSRCASGINQVLIHDSITSYLNCVCHDEIEGKNKIDKKERFVNIQREHIILLRNNLFLHLCQLNLRLFIYLNLFWIICVIALLYIYASTVISKNLMLVNWGE